MRRAGEAFRSHPQSMALNKPIASQGNFAEYTRICSLAVIARQIQVIMGVEHVARKLKLAYLFSQFVAR